MSAFDIAQREIIADLDNLKGPEASKALARLAADQRDIVISQDKPSLVTTYVDGQQGAALESVSPLGVVRFEFGYLDQVVKSIIELLVMRSPHGGAKRLGANPATHYGDEHKMFVDGLEVDAITFYNGSERLPVAAEVVLVNLQPYSRKIEKGLSLQAPSGVYEAVANLAKRRFGNSANITFTYLEFPGAGPGGPRSRKGGTASKRADDRFPAITVVAR